MSTPFGPRRTPVAFVVAGLLVPALCCGLPVLIAAGAIGAAGAALTDPWVIGAAAMVVVVVATLFARRRRGSVGGRRGCARAPGDAGRSDQPRPSSSLTQER
ncbi:hypothetical protein MSM1_10060 [Mycobacterium sp. SM1]|uniref:hypothetical protein n=1 Tax=Mycobacterium sp. SM1 TaxID=2816243 RepID=UPI001BCB36CE|nr:hypothetical protein [Mycobacterium sp. SM1]MBS4728661.1 hypothetical protein [Mycobacterium sp. SM1]